MSKGQDASTRFNQLCDRRGAGECWLWLGAKRSAGHGQFRLDKVTISAHAASLILSGVPKPSAGAHALHSCDNPSCVNPAHLRWGTPHDNIRDMVDRGRSWKMPGEANPRAKITAEAALSIYRLRNRQGEWGARGVVAREHGVSNRTVSDIWEGYSWSSVTGAAPARVRNLKI